jgi:hypothetical protein
LDREVKKEVLESLLKIFALSLLVSVIFLTVRLTEERQEMRKEAVADYVASLSLAPTQVELEPNESFTLDVILDTGGEAVVGVDVILYFDSDLLEVVDIAPNHSAFKTFVPFSTDNWVKRNQNNPSRSTIEFGAVIFDQGQDQVTGPVSGVINPLITIAFRARSGSQSAIFFGFEGLGATRDSNVVVVSGEEVSDILQDPSENDCQVTISNGATVTPTPTPGCDYTCDVNEDGVEDVSDYNHLQTCLFDTYPFDCCPKCDLNCDDKVDAGDVSMFTIYCWELIPTPTPTISPSPGTGDVRFQVRFQGINGGQPNSVRVKGILKQDGIEKYRNDNIITENDGSGIFVEMFRYVSPGTYDALIKGPAHLQKNFGEVTVLDGQRVDKDWTAEPIKTGDFNDDNKLNILDLSEILSHYTALSVPINESNQLYDVDGSGVIDIADIALVLSNYTALEIYGDE